MTALEKNGIVEDPQKATSEHGEIYLQILTEFLVSEL